MNSKQIIATMAALAGITIGVLLARHWQQEWYAINAPFGKKLGYPDCCIQQFCDQPPQLMRFTGSLADMRMRYEAAKINGEYTGFIPCTNHAKQILNGEITLQSLIKNRSSEFSAFPDLAPPQPITIILPGLPEE